MCEKVGTGTSIPLVFLNIQLELFTMSKTNFHLYIHILLGSPVVRRNTDFSFSQILSFFAPLIQIKVLATSLFYCRTEYSE